ncbi:MAG TPA: hypothetical protein VKR58_10435 [Aquella sp.]|nr:hypothetical protein [Aquella sp.]
MSDIVTYSVPESTQLELVIIDDKSVEPAEPEVIIYASCLCCPKCQTLPLNSDSLTCLCGYLGPPYSS